ncbi:MAG TPA: undecaprenyl-diphosphate phosphatase [Planctomycetota bacterium]|nr:undecaprenyl-diphosphate phosphatase [Planctomycetota bacterium]
MIYYFNALIKGIIEGITEFLPISSTGHLILAREWFPLTADQTQIKRLDDLFDIVIQLPAIFAIVLLYRARLWESAKSIPSNAKSRSFWFGLVLAVLPVVILGPLVHHRLEDDFMYPVPVAIALIVGGIILILVERGADTGKYAAAEDVPLPTAFFIGIFQCFSMFPGTSRSGATIVGGRLLHLTRNAATEYSFFLAIPTMCGAFVFKMYKAWHDIRREDVPVLLIGSVTSFVVSWIVVKWLIGYVKKHSLAVFGYYRIVLGALTLAYFYFMAVRK